MKVKSAAKSVLLALLSTIVLSKTMEAAPITLMPPDEWPSPNWLQVNFGTPSVQAVTVNGDRWLEIARTTSNVGSGQVVYTGGVPSPTAVNQFADFAGSVLIRGTMSTDGGGVILRAQTTAFGATSQYYLAVTTNSGGSQLGSIGIYNGTSNFIYQETPLAIQNASIAANVNYKLAFSAVGPALDAFLYQYNAVSGLYDTPIASIHVSDAAITGAGYVGLRGGRYGSNAYTQFNDFELQAIPEPQTLALGLLGALLLIFHAASSRRKPSAG